MQKGNKGDSFSEKKQYLPISLKPYSYCSSVNVRAGACCAGDKIVSSPDPMMHVGWG